MDWHPQTKQNQNATSNIISINKITRYYQQHPTTTTKNSSSGGISSNSNLQHRIIRGTCEVIFFFSIDSTKRTFFLFPSDASQYLPPPNSVSIIIQPFWPRLQKKTHNDIQSQMETILHLCSLSLCCRFRNIAQPNQEKIDTQKKIIEKLRCLLRISWSSHTNEIGICNIQRPTKQTIVQSEAKSNKTYSICSWNYQKKKTLRLFFGVLFCSPASGLFLSSMPILYKIIQLLGITSRDSLYFSCIILLFLDLVHILICEDPCIALPLHPSEMTILVCLSMPLLVERSLQDHREESLGTPERMKWILCSLI